MIKFLFTISVDIIYIFFIFLDKETKMNIKEELACKYCNQIFNNPVTLPCGDTICKHHIEELISNNTSNKFACPLCNEEILNQNLSVNKILEMLIKRELQGFKLNRKYEEVFKNLKADIQSLETILQDPENYIYEEINELKRRIDLDRERLKSEIDKLANDLIQQLESFGSRFKSEYKTNVVLNYYNDLV